MQGCALVYLRELLIISIMFVWKFRYARKKTLRCKYRLCSIDYQIISEAE